MAETLDRLGVLKIHFPLDRPETASRREDCREAVEEHSEKLRQGGVTSLLLTDHNTHGRQMPEWGGRKLMSDGFDYIGVNVARKTWTTVIRKRTLKGNIDNHDYIGVRLRVTWPSGRKTKIWFVQSNMGRGVDSDVFRKDARRLKRRFRGHVVWGFDEIDEADKVDEHKILREVWKSTRFTLCGWRTMSPVIVSKRLQVLDVRITKACEGLAKVTPHRDLVEVIIAPPVPWAHRVKTFIVARKGNG